MDDKSIFMQIIGVLLWQRGHGIDYSAVYYMLQLHFVDFTCRILL